MAWANEEATRIERDVIAAEVDELRTKREAAEWREAVKKANSLPSARNGRGVIQLSNADGDVDPAMEAELSDLIAQDENCPQWMADQLKARRGR